MPHSDRPSPAEASPTPAAHTPLSRAPRAEDLPCDYCGGGPLVWRKCKLICEQCRQINKSCADL